MEKTNQTRQNKRRFLLIDDDPIYAAIIKRIAENEGLLLESYKSLTEVEHLFSTSFEAIALDLQLEVENGIEIAKQIDLLNPKLPVILISNNSVEQERKTWPICIKKFIHKSCGHRAIVWELMRAKELRSAAG